MTNPALNAQLNPRTAIDAFASHEDIRHALFLTYNFDGEVIEDAERGLMEAVWRRNCTNVLVVRDGKAVLTEKMSLGYSVINASYSTRIFHPKLMLLMASSSLLAMVGSANLSRGGLESNLEIGTAYQLTSTEGPLGLFQAVHSYLQSYVRREIGASSPAQHGAFDIMMTDIERFLTDARPARSPVEPLFLHNYEAPLLPQIISALPSQKLQALWIVSPFFEQDQQPSIGAMEGPKSNGAPTSGPARLVGQEDPPDDVLDTTLVKELLSSLTFEKSERRPVRIFFQASSTNVTRLPLEILRKHQSLISLYAKDPTAIDQRSLHAKLLVFMGCKSSGQRFVTIVHGSANFTRAALLTSPPAGNAEIVMLTQATLIDAAADKLEAYFDLMHLFSEIQDWSVLRPSPPMPLPAIPIVQVWEGTVFLDAKKVSVYFSVTCPDAQYVQVTLCGESEDRPLGRLDSPFVEGVNDFKLPDEAFKSINSELGLRQLPYHSVCVEAFDTGGRSLGSGTAALNVDRPDTFIRDIQVPDSLDHQIYLAGYGGSVSYEMRRADIEKRLTATSHDGSPPGPSHYAQLDQFFRRLHIGFSGLHHRLEQGNGSLFLFGSVLRELGRWAERTTHSDEQYSTEQRLYLSDCIMRSVLECTEFMENAGHSPAARVALVQQEFVARARTIYDYATTLRSDESLGIAARELLQQWRKIDRRAKEK